MTPMEYGTTTDCEFVGGPVDGLAMRISNNKEACIFTAYARSVVTVKSCGVKVIQTPYYKRINDRRFAFVGYR